MLRDIFRFFGSPLRLFSVGIFCGIFPSFWHTTRFGTEILRERKKSIIRSQLKLGWKNWEKTTKKMGRSFKYKVRNEMKMDCFMTNVLKKSYLFECWLMLFQEITYAGTWTCNWTCTWLVYDLLYCANLIYVNVINQEWIENEWITVRQNTFLYQPWQKTSWVTKMSDANPPLPFCQPS